MKVLAKHGPSQRSRFKSFKKELNFCCCPASGLFFGIGNCLFVCLLVCLFVCYRSSGTLVSFYDGDSGVFYRCGTTDLNNPVETNDFTTLLQIFPNCTPHDSWKHMETSSALWKSNPWLQLFESRLSSLLDRFPVSWIQQISWILGNKNRGDRSDLPFIYCSG